MLQLYLSAYHHVHDKDPPYWKTMYAFLAACDEPVALLQQRFLAISQRISQVW